MTSTAMLPQLGPPTTTQAQAPALFRDGAPWPQASCLALSARGLLDERAAIVCVDRHVDPLAASSAEDLLTWLGSGAEARWLLRVGDAGSCHARWLSGRLCELDARLQGDSARTVYLLRDRWSLILDRIVRDSWWAGSGEAAVRRDVTATTRLPPLANCSARTYLVNDRATRVFESGGEPWRLFDLLVYLSVVFDLNLRQDLVPGELLWRELPFEAPLAGTLRAILMHVLKSAGLGIDRREGDATGRRGLRLRPITRGRPITLTLADRASARSLVERFEAVLRREQEAIRLDPGAPVQVAGTFDLTGSWDEALEGEEPGAYDRDHASFLAHAEVYRRWSLAVDDPQAAALFADGVTPARLPRFRPRLDGGRCDPATGVLVEYSLDSGESWSDYTGETILSPGRAELYLAAPALPDGFAAAGNAGTLRLRVSAVLRSAAQASTRCILGNVFLSDEDDDSGEDLDAYDEQDAPPGDGDDDADSFTLPADNAPPDEPDDDDDDATHGVGSYFAGQPRTGRAAGTIVVTIGPIDPDVSVGDLVTKIRGGRSPSVYVQRTGPLRVERLEHDLAGRQQTKLWLTPVRAVE